MVFKKIKSLGNHLPKLIISPLFSLKYNLIFVNQAQLLLCHIFYILIGPYVFTKFFYLFRTRLLFLNLLLQLLFLRPVIRFLRPQRDTAHRHNNKKQQHNGAYCKHTSSVTLQAPLRAPLRTLPRYTFHTIDHPYADITSADTLPLILFILTSFSSFIKPRRTNLSPYCRRFF